MFLNDDCVYRVLEWLPLRDVCVFSRTSKRFRELSEDHFRRKYPAYVEGKVIVEFDYTDKLQYQNYVKYFRNSIDDIEIHGWVRHPNQPSLLANFIQTKCAENLHTISIVGDIELTTFSELIRNNLRNVRVVKFNDRLEATEDEPIFLKCCPRLEKLILGHNITTKKIEFILDETYSELTHFDCARCDMLNAAKFFESNDKIEWISWHPLFRYGTNVSKDDQVKCILTLNYVTNLKYLFLSIEKFLTEKIEDICKLLNFLCHRNNFESLELELLSDSGLIQLNLRVHQLSTWKQLTKIRFVDIKLSDVIPALRSLANLNVVAFKLLCLESNYDDLKQEELYLPQVEELQVKVYDHQQESLSVILCVKYWPNLKRILLYKSYGESVKYDARQLSHERKKMENACAVTIFSDHKGIKTDLENELVKVKFINFKTDFDNNFQKN